jgi:hypothetical protein
VKFFSRAGGAPQRIVRGTAMASAVLLAGMAISGTPTASAQGPRKDRTTRAIEHVGPVPGGFASWKDLLAFQDRLVDAADRITEAVRRDADSGYAGIVLSPEDRELRLYWKGRQPESIAALVAGLRGDVTVRTLSAPHSARRLSAEAAKLTRRDGGKITSVAPTPDGSGLTVAGPKIEAARAAADEVSVPVTFHQGVKPAPATRWNDSPPWWGGAAWRNAATGGGCSTGFAVLHAGVTKILSAGHCGAVGNTATDPRGEVMGAISNDDSTRDVLLIDARSAGRVLNNQIGNTSVEFSNPVIGTIGSYAGLWVCTSGAYSGTNCGIRAKQAGVSIWVGHWIDNTVMAEQSAHTNAIGRGDSGGSVEVVDPADTAQVYAAGISTAIDTGTSIPCTGYVISGRTCAWRMYYSPWSNAVASFGVSIVTG